jgi:hypothetical protein
MEEVYDLYSSPDIIRHIRSRRMRWAGHVARMGEKRSAEGGVDWIRLAQDREQWRAVVNAMMNLRVLASRS